MKRLGLILAVLTIAIGAWADWSYRAARTEIAEIKSRLPSEEVLNAMPPGEGETEEPLKGAMADCRRVDRFKCNPLVRMLKRDELNSLAEQCELIKSRQDALQGP
jgi:hypothetical protein